MNVIGYCGTGLSRRRRKSSYRLLFCSVSLINPYMYYHGSLYSCTHTPSDILHIEDHTKKADMFPVSLAPYVYTPLETIGSIHLMELLPGDQVTLLRCSLTQSRRTRARQYEALSYAWGKADFSWKLIEVATDTSLLITESLYDALQAVRLQEERRRLWVDAV
ncbi:hypothetical protein HBI56_162850 [Parastagonospora nodorum]|nr:hypothetical protein HBH53_159860 [Parastagonospora nodorum]KAH4342069.1 hypothetical protein HBH98_166680 [Parastagonospora nodorum]KAH4367234.1 hypothetical protein HBH97_163160 [Parastagonospora nodorum]KAH4389399.1 hypothetical protein HBH99_158650 [Parastagonospora nodorum]KAH4905482.1 hypothetical protein HBI80_088420 [Parastagonospora nodorum]